MDDSLALVAARLRKGVASSSQVQRELALSQATVSRIISSLGAAVVRIGRGRSTQYGLRRDISGIGDQWPIFEIDALGAPVQRGRLYALHGNQYWFEARTALHSSLTDGLPYFLQDLWPQGFIGRTVPRRHPDLDLPERIADWNDDHVLTFLVRRGEDLIGSWVIGDESLERYLRASQRAPAIVRVDERPRAYEALAQAAIAGDPAGSSAGGEHPKFTSLVSKEESVYHVLVKFSPEGDDPVSRRWADLLIAEHVALSSWCRAQGELSTTELVFGERRVFLESRRFDRVDAVGRRGVISLAALDDAFLGRRQDWTRSTRDLASMGKISAADFEVVRRTAAFGRVIANTDMHFGNLSFFAPWDAGYSLAPLYDMLPMRYAPSVANALPAEPMEVPVPTADSLDIWAETVSLGIEFWGTVAAHPKISASFAELARANAGILRQA